MQKKFQIEILIINMIYGIVYFREIILESSWNVIEKKKHFRDEALWLIQVIKCHKEN